MRSKDPRNPKQADSEVDYKLQRLASELRDGLKALRDDLDETQRQLSEQVKRPEDIENRVLVSLASRPEILGGAINHVVSSRLDLLRNWVLATLVILGLVGAGIWYSVGGPALVRQMQTMRDEAKQLLDSMKKEEQKKIIRVTDLSSDSIELAEFLGSVYSENPRAEVATALSPIPAFDPRTAGWRLMNSAASFPLGTIFVVLVNPGGETSSPILVKTQTQHILIGYRNESLNYTVSQLGVMDTFSISWDTSNPSMTGGAILGAVAGALSMGSKLDDRLKPLVYVPTTFDWAMVSSGRIAARVVDIDSFLNAAINVRESDLLAIGVQKEDKIIITFDGQKSLVVPLKSSFDAVSRGTEVAVLYDRLLVLGIAYGHFTEKHHITRGQSLTLQKQ